MNRLSMVTTKLETKKTDKGSGSQGFYRIFFEKVHYEFFFNKASGLQNKTLLKRDSCKGIFL